MRDKRDHLFKGDPLFRGPEPGRETWTERVKCHKACCLVTVEVEIYPLANFGLFGSYAVIARSTSHGLYGAVFSGFVVNEPFVVFQQSLIGRNSEEFIEASLKVRSRLESETHFAASNSHMIQQFQAFETSTVSHKREM